MTKLNGYTSNRLYGEQKLQKMCILIKPGEGRYNDKFKI